jgi:hypothetical protein
MSDMPELGQDPLCESVFRSRPLLLDLGPADGYVVGRLYAETEWDDAARTWRVDPAQTGEWRYSRESLIVKPVHWAEIYGA